MSSKIQRRNRHHLLWTRKEWGKYRKANEIRNAFVYKIDESLHEELHIHVGAIPVPKDLGQVYARFKVIEPSIQYMDIFNAVSWLCQASEDELFCQAMQVQYGFLLRHIKELM